jgi:hypothetical protein
MQVSTVHGVTYIRSGNCRRCGACEKDTCPHFSMVDGLSTCAVHGKKTQICEQCSTDNTAWAYRRNTQVTHAVCAEFPTHPFARVIKSGECGYEFEPVTEKDKQRHQELIDAWQ